MVVYSGLRSSFSLALHIVGSKFHHGTANADTKLIRLISSCSMLGGKFALAKKTKIIAEYFYICWWLTCCCLFQKQNL